MGQLPTKYRNYTGNDYETYVHLVEAVVELFVEHNRANVSNERLRKEAEDIVEFEKKIYEVSTIYLTRHCFNLKTIHFKI